MKRKNLRLPCRESKALRTGMKAENFTPSPSNSLSNYFQNIQKSGVRITRHAKKERIQINRREEIRTHTKDKLKHKQQSVFKKKTSNI